MASNAPNRARGQIICGCLDWQASVYINVFLACSSFSCALPTIEPYLAELHALPLWAYAVAIYSVGQFVASPFWGYLSGKHRSENMLYASLLIGVAGGFLYATAQSGPQILIARLLIGLYTGSQEACHRTIVVRCTEDEQRTIAQAGVSTATVLGFLFGPALAGIFFFQALGPVQLLGINFRLDSFTGPGWLIVLFCCISSVLVTIGLTEEQTKALPQLVPVAVETAGSQSRVSHADDGQGSPDGDKRESACSDKSHSRGINKRQGGGSHFFQDKDNKEDDAEAGSVAMQKSLGRDKMPLRVSGIVVCGLVLFVNALGFSAYETITTPLVKNDFGWDLFYADLLFIAAGVVCILVFIAIRITSARVEDRYLLLCGVVVSTFGYGLMIEFFDNRLPLTRFLVGFAAVNAAMELNRSVTMSLASKILPPTSQHQGFLQGILISCVACARIIGPVYAVWVWDATDRERFSQGHWVFLGLFVSFFITTVAYLIFLPSLRPYKVLYDEWVTEQKMLAPLLGETPGNGPKKGFFGSIGSWRQGKKDSSLKHKAIERK